MHRVRTYKYAAAMMLIVLSACGDALDTSRVVTVAPSLGASLYEEVCHRVAHNENPKDVSGQSTWQTCRYGAVAPSVAGPALLALTQERGRFIAAVDKAIDPNMAEDLGRLLTGMLPLYDDGTMQAHMVAVGEAVTAIAQAPDAVAALGRLAARRGYVQTHANFAQAWLTYDGLDALTRAVLLTPAAQKRDSWHLLQRSLSEQLTRAPEAVLHQGAKHVAVLSQFLLRPIEETSAQPSTPRWVVRRDVRGIAMPSTEYDRPKAPFVDHDGDGLADVDAAGRYIGRDGLALSHLPTPFPIAKRKDTAARTEHARALRDDGALWYQYRDAAPTVLASVFEQVRALLDVAPDAALSWAQVAQAATGSPTSRRHHFDDGTTQDFLGFDAFASPLIDVAQGLVALGQGPELQAATEHLLVLWQSAETQIADVVGLSFDVARLQHEEATPYAPKLKAGTPLVDDLVEVAAQMAYEPGLLEDIILAFADPQTSSLGARLAEQMRHKDRIDFDPEDVNALATGDFATRVDREVADTARNASVFERLLHLVHDASGKRICSNPVLEPFPNYAPCELFEIDDAAAFYVEAMAGTATLTMKLREDDFFFPEQLQEAAEQNPGRSEMEAFSGIDGFERIDNAPNAPAQYMTFKVTPQAAARLLFAMYDDRVPPDSLYGTTRAAAQMVTPRLMVDDVPFDVLHGGTLFAWEKNGFFESMQPLLQAFAKHGREDLLSRFVATLHLHWPTRASTVTQNADATKQSFAHQTGLSALEPLFARLLDEEALLDRLGALARASNQAQAVSTGVSGPHATAALLQRLLTVSDASSAPMRAGLDARTGAQAQTPATLLVRGMTDIAANIAAELPQDSQAASLAEQFWHLALDIDDTGGAPRFKNRKAYALTQAWLRFALERMASREDGATSPSPQQRVADFRDALSGTALQQGLSLVAAMAADADVAHHSAQLCRHMLDARLGATLEATTDALQMLGDTDNMTPLFKQMALWLTPQTGVVSHSLHVLRALQDIDEAQTMPRLVQGLVRDLGDETPLAALVDIFGRVNRVRPGDDDILAAEDFEAFLGVLDHLIHSPDHGFMRLVHLVESRHTSAPDTF